MRSTNRSGLAEVQTQISAAFDFDHQFVLLMLEISTELRPIIQLAQIAQIKDRAGLAEVAETQISAASDLDHQFTCCQSQISCQALYGHGVDFLSKCTFADEKSL